MSTKFSIVVFAAALAGLSAVHAQPDTKAPADTAVPVTAEIARRATALAWHDLPDDLIERTKQCLLDWFAVTVAGAQEELTDILIREAIEDGAKGPASLVGRSETTLPSTAVRACARCPFRTSRTGLTAAASASMIPSSRSGSKTSTASDSEPREAREQPSLRCTLRSSLSRWMPRSDRAMGLNSESRTSMQY